MEVSAVEAASRYHGEKVLLAEKVTLSKETRGFSSRIAVLRAIQLNLKILRL